MSGSEWARAQEDDEEDQTFIKIPKDIAARLYAWHGGQGSMVYAIASSTGGRMCDIKGAIIELRQSGTGAYPLANELTNLIEHDKRAMYIDGMARMLHCSAWANMCDRVFEDTGKHVSPSAGGGEDWFNVSPETPDVILRMAEDILVKGNFCYSYDDPYSAGSDSALYYYEYLDYYMNRGRVYASGTGYVDARTKRDPCVAKFSKSFDQYETANPKIIKRHS